MGNPGATITIELQALTDAANAKLSSFFRQIQNDAKAANLAVASSATQSVSSVASGIENAAKATTTKIAGMSYYARSAIDGIRVALAGGGARAGFYAIDEAVRGLLASGIALGTLVPILGALAAVVGGGVLVWREYTSAEREAEKAAKDLHDRIKATADLLTQMKDLQKAGLLSPEAVQRNRDILSGKIKLYKTPEGDVTEQPTHFEAPQPAKFERDDLGVQMLVREAMTGGQQPNRPLTGDELTKYVQNNLSVPGGLDPEQAKAQAKLEEMRAEIHAKSLSDLDSEIQKIHQKYENERAEIKDTATLAGNLITPEQQNKNNQALEESKANERLEISRKFEEQQTKVNEEYAKGRADFARTANEKLDRDLEESAAAQGKTRQQIYQEEYDKRKGLLDLLRVTGFLTEQQYTDAVKEAQAKRLVGYDQEKQRLKEIDSLKEKLSERDFEYQRKQIEQNPFLNAGQKNAGLLDINSQQTDLVAAALQANQSALATEQNPEKQIQLLQQEKDLLGQLNVLYLERQKLEEDQPGFLNQWSAGLSKLNGEWSDLGGNAAKNALSIMQDGLQAVSSSITDMIVGTRNWGEAFAQSARKAVAGIIQMATQYVASKAAMAAVDAAFTTQSKSNAATTTAASGTAGIAKAGEQGGWVGVLIYMGVFLAAMAAMEAIAAGVAGGFKEGGYTGDGPADQVAGLVHRGEFVIPAERVRQFGGGVLESIRNGSFNAGSAGGSSASGPGGLAGGSVVQHTTQMHLAVVDSEAAAKRVLEGEDGEKFWLSMADKHISKYQQ